MASRSGLIGFTLGELGLLVAFALLFMMRLSWQETPDTTAIDSLERRVDSLESILDSVQSAQVPSCDEKGIISGFLFTVTVVGANQYRVKGEYFSSVQELLLHFEEAMERAEEAGCIHQIGVRPAPNIALEPYRAGVKRLAQHFYYAER